jgi:hypothetical protein
MTLQQNILGNDGLVHEGQVYLKLRHNHNLSFLPSSVFLSYVVEASGQTASSYSVDFHVD